MIDSFMENQATINIGTIGHVAHGKSTIVQCISGTSTIKYKSELERNITIKLGYANAKIYACQCERPQKYSTSPGNCSICSSKKQLVRHISFVDCPGHDVLMATMLNGTAIMDAAVLLVAANESCPQPQTTEHLFAVEIMNLNKIIVVQNKIDLITREQALEQYDQIKEFMKTSHVDAPVIPVSGQLKINIEAVLDFLVNYIEVPERNREENPRMIIIRSFDINKPGTKIKDLQGGVIGGSLTSGMIKLGDEIEIRPGIVEKRNNEYVCKPFTTKIISLKAERTSLKVAVPGGLIGVGTDMDPSYCKSDKLVGMVMGLRGSLPPIFSQIKLNYELFQKTVTSTKEELKEGEQMLLNIGSTTSGAKITYLENNTVAFDLVKPCCCEINERIAISRKIKNNWRLVGWGIIIEGEKVSISYE